MRKVKGMNWKARISLVMILTMMFSAFMYQGFLRPRQAHAAHTLDTSAQAAIQATNPATLSYTCGAGTTVLVVMIAHTNASRTGGAPTYNGLTMTQVGAEVLGAAEVGAEMWYLIDPPTGAAYTISVPNVGGANQRIIAVSFKAASGKTSALDVSSSTNVDAANPSRTLTTTVNGDAVVDILADGNNSAPTGRSHTLLYSNDAGAWVDESQYALQANLGNITLSHTVALENVAMIAAAFKEVTPPAAVPTLTSPTATSITNTTATLGANVTSDGGSAITERGTVWNTTGTPTTADNKTTTTGTTGVFTTNVSSITAATKIYYRGYAINGVGTAYSPQGSFYTEPTTQASGVNFTSVGQTGMTVNWTRGSGGAGGGVIVLMKSDSAVTGTPADGTYTGYAANTTFGSGTLITDGYVVYKGTGTSVAVTGLTAGTTYHIAVFEFAGQVDTAGDDQGTNYKLTPATGSQATVSLDSTPPVEGALSVSPEVGTYVPGTFTITEGFTDAESAITGCEYSIATPGPSWVGATWNPGPGTCTATPPAQANGTVLTIKMRATSTGGTSTPVNALSRTVDAAGPTDGALTVTPGNAQNGLSWTAATDPASGLRTANTYDVRFLTGGTPPSCTTGTSIYTGTGTSTTHLSLTNGQQYSYRVCAYDKFDNVSAGATGSGTPSAGPVNTLSVSGNTALATSPKNDTAQYVVMQRFQVDSDTQGGTDNAVVLSSLTLDDAGNAASIAAVRVYISADTSATLPASAVMIGKMTGWNGASQAITLNAGTTAARTVTNGTPKYVYVLYDMAAGQATNTVRSNVTAVGVGVENGVTGINYSSNLITLTTGAKASVATCADCHGNPPVDSAMRNNPAGQFPGSHNKHAGAPLSLACTACHTDNGANMGHRDGYINMSNPIYGGSGAYSKASGPDYRFLQVDNPVMGTCSNISCHANVYGSGTITTPEWGTAAGCNACHTTTIASTGPNTGSHATHNITDCSQCHAGATDYTTVPTANHADGDIDATNGYPATAKHAAGSYTGTCSTASCHANVYGSGTVTTPVWGDTSAGCSACHTTAIGTYGPATGSHSAAHGSTCTTCHNTGTTATTAPSSEHRDDDIDTANVGYTDNKAKGSPYTTCSTANCHANVYGSGTVTTPAWGSTGNGCNACHNVAIGTYGPATGSHSAAHGSTCTACHNPGTTATTAPSSEHRDDDIDTANVGYTDNKAKHASGGGYGTCSAASCHVNVYGSGTVTTPVWGDTSAGCSACHTTAIGTYGPATGSHSAAHGSTCTACHNAGTTATTAPSTEHRDDDIDTANVGYTDNKAKHAAGSGYGTCSTASCHGSSSPTWGTSTSYDTCTKCHGTGTATVNTANRYVVAPPKDTAGNSGTATGTGQVDTTANSKIGAHQTHLQYFNGLRSAANDTNDDRCNWCHGTLPVSGSHANGSSTPAFQGLATRSGAMSPSYAGVTCTNTYCHNPAGTGGTLASANAGTDTSPDWNNAAYLGDTLKTQANCDKCHLSPDGTRTISTSLDHSTYDVDVSDCVSCHGHNGDTQGAAGQRHMDGIKYGSGSCIDCHDTGGAGTTGPNNRSAIKPEFGLAYGHKKSGRGAVTDSDCIVCHLEGVFSTQTTSPTYHANGKIDLRDPDGAGETRITDISGGAFEPVKFSTSYAAGSRTSTGHTANTVDNVITQKFCLACHDSNGATNPTARTTYGAPTQYNPFGGVNLGANYTVANGAATAGGLIDVKSQFATGNMSRHPVMGPRNADYPTAARLADPYKPTGTRGTSGTRTNGVVINCFDCHNAPTTPLTTRTVSAHGNANWLRGTVHVSSPTLCTTCHINGSGAYTGSSTVGHSTGSAFTGTSGRMGATEQDPCNNCHASVVTPARPVGAQDMHGVNTLPLQGTETSRWALTNGQQVPIAFIRNTTNLSSHQPRTVLGTTYSPQCDMLCATRPGSPYTPGGTY